MTAIQWTDVTDNIIVAVDEAGNHHGWWCKKISPGCAHCYAEDLNQSTYFNGNKLKYSGSPPVLKLREDIIDSWARQRKPKKHFVCSMTDVLGEWVPRAWIFRYLDGMVAAPQQIFQVLTKRADVALREIAAYCEARGIAKLPANIWIGVSVEDQ
jgi:protein gp37